MGQRPNLNRHTTSTNRREKSSIARRPQTHYYTWILRVWKTSHGTHIDVPRYTHECVWRRVYLHRPTATKTPSYLDPAFVKFESWYIYRCVMVHIFVCVTADMSASPDGHKYISLLVSYMREKYTTVNLQMRHSTLMCVCHIRCVCNAWWR